MAGPKPRTFKGTRDFTPAEMIPRERLIERIKRVFRLYGFSPLETPALEMLSVLAGKYGEEGDKLLYKLDYKNDDFSSRVALRYDLTVPLARVVAAHPEWPMPFKRYQIQPVWRADRPQIRQGRFREFYQCDVDTVGAEEGLADAEILALTIEMLDELGFESGDRRAIVQLNHRRLLEAVCVRCGQPRERLADFSRALDKIDKIGREGVNDELARIGITGDGLARLDEVLESAGPNVAPLEVADRVRALFPGDPAATAGVDGLVTILRALDDLGAPLARISLNPALARGLDYYTGAVFETVLPAHPHIGSLTGGGRYDELIGLYGGADVPATGTTIGLDRMFAAMEQLGMVASAGATVTRVLLAAYSDEQVPACLHAVRAFREAGVPCELFPKAGKLKKPFAHADKLNIPFVAVIGPDEATHPDGLHVSLKDLSTGAQETVALAAAVKRAREAVLSS
ncbi:MAG: Histidine--tRNA ligase [Calditrichaeota bacterium]|nr:Histidine--tRNA ligase [Calditrichota bacterium]